MTFPDESVSQLSQDVEFASKTISPQLFPEDDAENSTTSTLHFTSNRSKAWSYIQSLPIANAEPETSRGGSVQFEATDVQPIAGKSIRQTKTCGLRPTLISVRIFKPTKNSALGVTFASVDGKLQIRNIASTGALRRSSLLPGDRVVSIDEHRDCIHWSAKKASTYIKKKDGLLSFVVRTPNGDPTLAKAVVYKTSETDKIGIKFITEMGRLQVKNIASEGLLGDRSVLSSGDYVQSINRTKATQLDSIHAAQLVRNATGLVHILVKNCGATEVSIRELAPLLNYDVITSEYDQGPIATAQEVKTVDVDSPDLSMVRSHVKPAFVGVQVFKATKATVLGIKIAKPDNQPLRISSIAKDGLLSDSPLKPGFRIWSIDNYRFGTWRKHLAVAYFKTVMGDLHIVGQDPKGDPRYKLAMAYKPTPRAKLGISFNSYGQRLTISRIENDGVFGKSILSPKDEVISINNIPCQTATAAEAAGITQHISGSVEILVRSSTSAVVLSHVYHS